MSETEKKTSKWPRRLLWLIGGLLTLALLTLLILRIYIVTDTGRSMIEQRVEALSPAGQSIDIEGLEGNVLSDFSVESITISDADGVWLTAEDVLLNWSAFALARKNIKIDFTGARKVDVLRRPIITQNTESLDSGFTINEILLDRFDFPEVNLAEPVIGQAVSLRSNGQLKHASSGGNLIALLQQSHGGADRADINLRWNDEELLTGAADIFGEKGGLIANLFRAPDARIEGTFETRQTETGVSSVLSVNLDSVPFLSGNIELADDGAKLNLTANPILHPMAITYQNWFSDTVTLSANLSELGDDLTGRFELASGQDSITSNITRSRNGWEFENLDVTFRNSALSDLSDSFDIQSLSFNGSASFGETRSLSGIINAQGLRVQNTRLDLLQGPISVEQRADQTLIETELTGKGITGQNADMLGGAPKANTRLLITGRNVQINRADIALPGLALSGQGRINFDALRQSQFRGNYTLDSAKFYAEQSAVLKGDINVTGRRDGTLDITSAGQASNILGLPAPLPEMIGQTAFFDTQASISSDGSIGLSTFNLNGDDISLEGRGRKSGQNISGIFKLGVEEFTYQNVNLAPSLSELTLSGTIENPQFELNTSTNEVVINRYKLTAASLDADGSLTRPITVNASLRGDYQDRPARVDAQIEQDGQEWAVREIDSEFYGAMASGEISGFGGELSDLRADLSLKGKAVFGSQSGATEIKIKINDQAVNIDGSIANITYGPVQNSTLTLKANGPREAVSFDAKFDGESLIASVTRPLSARLDGQLSLDGNAVDLTSNANIQTGRYSIATTKPATFKILDGTWSANADLEGLGGAITATHNSAKSEALSVDINGVELSQLLALMARPELDGTMNAKLLIRPDTPDAFMSFEGQLQKVKQPDDSYDPVNINMLGNISGGQLTSSASIAGDVNFKTRLSGPITTLQGFPYVRISSDQILNGEMILDGEVGILADLVLPPETRFSGQADSLINFTLPFSPQKLEGNFKLVSGRLEQGQMGFVLEDVNTNIIMANQRVSTTALSARGPSGGTLNGSGEFNFGGALSGSTSLKADNLTIFRRREGFARASGNIDLSGDRERIKLGGELIVTDGELNLENLPKSSRPTLDVRFGEFEDETDAPQRTFTEMDLALRTDGQIKLRGRGVNAQMAMDTKIKGAFSDPVITGRAEIVRGRFDFAGKQFELGDSTVTFEPNLMRSQLDVTATRETSELTAKVVMTGTLRNPEIKLTSEPELPEDQVLSYTLFGRSPTQLTGLETARLAAALAQLSGGSNFNMLGNLEDSLGLDNLNLTQSESGQTQITTGKYLADDVYLELQNSLEGGTGVVVEWTPRDNVAVEAQTIPGERQTLSVQWKKDFD